MTRTRARAAACASAALAPPAWCGAHNSAGWEFTRDRSQPPEEGRINTRTDTRLGLQANWQPDPRLEGAAQVVLKRLDPEVPAEQFVDWAYAAYRPTPQWTWRLGRTSPDVFLLVDYRNVGFAYPWVRPNPEFYGWLSLDSMDGLDASYAWQADAAWWRMKLAYGQSRTAQVVSRTGEIPFLENKGLFTATVSREDDGLLLKATFARTRSSLTGVPGLQRLNAALTDLQALPVPSVVQEAALLQNNVVFTDRSSQYLALGASYERGPWWLHAEVNRLGGDLVTSNGLRAYASVAYRVGRLTGFTVWGRALPASAPLPTPTDWGTVLAPLIGEAAAQQTAALGAVAADVANRGRTDQRSIGLGVRWDANARMALKLQWDHIKTNPLGSGLWESATPAAARSNLLSATLDFIF